eukprot:TRINITY_DN1616_c0_g1_i1.p2 TRINITY_DN1616_c0_g1~~TRINITY_DN1616_c0_g1_i1.p2  ORF type:complete len:147 (+),score=33.88 TRINITY_DN1616_c0_g1_i1:257-697(+)
MEERAKQREAEMHKNTESLRNEIVQISKAIDAIQDKIKEHTIEIASCKTNLMESETEARRINNKLANAKEASEYLAKEKEILEGELELLNESKKRAELELLKLKEINATTAKSHSINTSKEHELSLIHICRCRRYAVCRSRWSPYH